MTDDRFKVDNEVEISTRSEYHEDNIVDRDRIFLCAAFLHRIYEERKDDNNAYKKRTAHTLIPVCKQVHVEH